MVRVREFFEPEYPGEYWRSVYNCIRDLPAYSPEIPAVIFRSHEKDNDGCFIVPNGTWRYRSSAAEMIEQLITDTNAVMRFYLAFEKDIVRAFRKALRLYGKYPHKTSLPAYITEDLSETLRILSRPSSSTLRDNKRLTSWVHDFWFSCGWYQQHESLFKLTAGILSLEIDLTRMEKVPVDPLYFRMPPTETWGGAEWLVKNFQTQSQFKNDPGWIARFTDAMVVGAGAVQYLYDLEQLRSIARKTWTENQQALTAAEMLVLQKHVRLMRVSIDNSTTGFPVISPSDVRQKLLPFEGSAMLMWSDLLSTPHGPIGIISANAVIDFLIELDHFNKYKAYKGSCECTECGTFMPRSFDGYGKKYCSEQCKKRAAKRRYTAKKRLGNRRVS